MKLEIEDISLLEISAVFTKEYEPIIIEILRKNNLTEHMEGFFKSETHLHTNRVSSYSALLAEYYGLPNKQIEEVRKIAPFHDFGKLKIPEKILNKPKKLTEEEFETIKSHPKIGFDLLIGYSEFLDTAALVAYEHHERWDGKGYPLKIKGDKIFIYSRIVACADVLDSLLSKRCYKVGWSKESVREHFKNESGKHFDPILAKIVVDNFEEFYNRHKIICYI